MRRNPHPMNAYLLGELEPDAHARWQTALRAASPSTTWLDAIQAAARPEQVDVAVVASPRPGALLPFTRLRLIQSLWAGVDRLLGDPQLPADVPLARMVDPAMNAAMAETALWAVLSLQRDFFTYAAQQTRSLWLTHGQRTAADVTVTVLGLGQMGQAVARRLVEAGYRVQAWTQRPRVDVDSRIECHAGDLALEPLLARGEIVVNLLPLTAQTRHLFDRQRLALLPAGAALINLARGGHVDEDALLAALNQGRLSHAVLDVFAHEPLPSAHPFWQHPGVTLLPHVAAQTDPRSAAQVVAANLHALATGQPIAHRVNRQLGY